MNREVWMISAEAAPLVHVGGLGDVLRALPSALRRQGYAARRFLPAYRAIGRDGFTPEGPDLRLPLGGGMVRVGILSRTGADGVITSLVVQDELYDRDGIYGDGAGDYPDNARRFTLLCRAVCELARRSPRPPGILHAHDWHAALVPLFVRWGAPWKDRPGTLLTIHNMGYQGRFPMAEMRWLGLDPPLRDRLFVPAGIEYYGDVNCLKAGLLYADRLTAVSPTYAAEIMTPEQGYGLDGVVRERSADLTGVLNGADYAVWDPRIDPHIPRRYDRDHPERKEEARAALWARLRFGAADRPIVGLIARLVHQKGIDVVLAAGDEMVGAGADLALLGSGDGDLAGGLRDLERRHPGRVAFYDGYNEALAHLILAGSDLLLVPSRYEPCGLVQMHALRYGTLPVVHRTGGLADTVRDEEEFPGRGTGFVFDSLARATLAAAVRRAIAVRSTHAPLWEGLRRRAMAEDFSWDRAAMRYVSLYEAIGGGAPAGGRDQAEPGKSLVSEPEAGR